jgi:hypothetical protein
MLFRDDPHASHFERDDDDVVPREHTYTRSAPQSAYARARAAPRPTSSDRGRLDELDAIQSQLRRHRSTSRSPPREPVYVDRKPDEYIDIPTSPAPPPEKERRSQGQRMASSGSPRNGHPYWLDPAVDELSPPAASATRASAAGPAAGGVLASAAAQLRAKLPYLSPGFQCGEDDAEVLLLYLHHGASSAVGSSNALEEKMAQLECEVKTLTQRLQKRTDEISRLKDEVAEAKQKQRAVEAQAKTTANVLSQRREETRKQLVMEETRNAKLQFQNKTLTTEVEKLKERVHQLLSR